MVYIGLPACVTVCHAAAKAFHAYQRRPQTFLQFVKPFLPHCVMRQKNIALGG